MVNSKIEFRLLDFVVSNKECDSESSDEQSSKYVDNKSLHIQMFGKIYSKFF